MLFQSSPRQPQHSQLTTRQSAVPSSRRDHCRSRRPRAMASTVRASPTLSLPRAPSRAARLPRRRASRETRGKGWRDDSPLDAGDATTRAKAKRSKTRERGGTTGVGKGTEEGCELRAIDLGQGKSVELYVPRDDAVADVAGDRVSLEVLEGFRRVLVSFIAHWSPYDAVRDVNAVP